MKNFIEIIYIHKNIVKIIIIIMYVSGCGHEWMYVGYWKKHICKNTNEMY